MTEHIQKRLKEWEHLGVRRSPDGSRIVAHTPRDYPEAYLHRFLAPVPASAWRDYMPTPPKQLEELFRECNGLSIFAGTLKLYGIRAHYKRDDSAQFQPFDLATHHHEVQQRLRRRLPAGKQDGVFFGSYDYDGSKIFSAGNSPQILRISRESGDVLNTWRDLEYFLSSEYDRIDQLFGREGYLLDKEAPTTPLEDP